MVINSSHLLQLEIALFYGTNCLLHLNRSAVNMSGRFCVSLFQYFSESKMKEKNQFSLIRKCCVVGINLHVTKTAMLQVSSINKF